MRHLALIVSASIVLVFGAIWLLAPELFSRSSSTGEALIGGSFSVIDHRGQPFTEKQLQGHYSLIYFGFTYCPDICPTGLLTIAETLDSLPESLQEQIQPIFVTVDPERDTPEVMANYVANFHPKLIGLTGSSEQIKGIADAYKVYYQVAPQENSPIGYLVDHSGYMYLMNPDGRYVQHFPHNVTAQALADGLRRAMH